MKPLVSIIFSIYEIKTEYLNACLDSILNQTYQNFEIIAINDCSPKTKYDYITKLSPKIKLYKNEINLGLNKSLNKALKYVSGKYIVRLDCDDIFEPTLLEEEVNALENNQEYGAVCCELKQFGNGNRHITRPNKWDLKEILNGKLSGTGWAGGLMFRSNLLDKISINENYKMCEDFDFHLQILEQMPIMSIHKILYYYRIHNTNLCKSIKRIERLSIIDKIISSHKKKLNID